MEILLWTGCLHYFPMFVLKFFLIIPTISFALILMSLHNCLCKKKEPESQTNSE